MLYTHKTQTYFSLGLQIFQDLDKFLAAQSGIHLLCEHFPQSSSKRNKKRTTMNYIITKLDIRNSKDMKNE